MSKKLNLDAMTVDELWHLHQEITRILVVRVTSQQPGSAGSPFGQVQNLVSVRVVVH